MGCNCGDHSHHEHGHDRECNHEEVDYMLAAMAEHWEHVVRIYRELEEKRPIMLYDMQEGQIYACPFDSFKAGMPEDAQPALNEIYELAAREDKMVVFVRDNEAEQLKSYLLDYK